MISVTRSSLPILMLLMMGNNLLAQPQVPVRQVDPNQTSPGEFIIDPPTLQNLGFEWFIEGDENRNASVSVSYRKQGERQWHDALPLLRMGNERIYIESRVDVIVPPMFAGSILDLEPGTPYEVSFTLHDPDGVKGQASKTLVVSTRSEPVPFAGGREFHVYPPGFSGDKIEPAFEGLMCAYHYWCAGTDWATSGRPRVRPGDTILVHAGEYKYNRYEYTNNPLVNRTVPLDGTYYLTADGTEDMPIAIKAAGDGEVIFDGDGNYALFDVRAADYTYFEGITFRNTEYAILAGTQFLAGSKGLTVKQSRFEDVGAGVFTNFAGSSNFYIADNYFYGRNDPDHMIGWASDLLWHRFDGVDGQVHPPVMASYVAIKLYGPGHVVAYNFITDFHDGINVETYGAPNGSVATGPGIIEGPHYPPREYWSERPVAIDFYNNYISNSHDNPIEADGSMHNIRIMRNMLINHPSHAFCNQPALGGPVYWIRNIAYNLPGGSTRLTAGSTGVLFYNNTILSETLGNTQNSHWRNNLILGQNAVGFTGDDDPVLFGITTNTNYTSSDYNGFGPIAGQPVNFAWSSPALEVMADYPGPGKTPDLQTREFETLGDYSAATGQDSHSIMLGYDIFGNVPQLNGRDFANVQNIYDASDFDFSLVRGSAAIDAGMELPNVTDGFKGRAPDLGALERGEAMPHYGPRD